jgi:hypothetical protein
MDEYMADMLTVANDMQDKADMYGAYIDYIGYMIDGGYIPNMESFDEMTLAYELSGVTDPFVEAVESYIDTDNGGVIKFSEFIYGSYNDYCDSANLNGLPIEKLSAMKATFDTSFGYLDDFSDTLDNYTYDIIGGMTTDNFHDYLVSMYGE